MNRAILVPDQCGQTHLLDQVEDWWGSAFYLSENVTCHDGEPLAADDVVSTNNAVPLYIANNFQLVESAEKVDDFTVSIPLRACRAASRCLQLRFKQLVARGHAERCFGTPRR